MADKIPLRVAEQIRSGPTALGQVNQQLAQLLQLQQNQQARAAAGQLAQEKLQLQQEELGLQKQRLNLAWAKHLQSLGTGAATTDLTALHAVRSHVLSRIADARAKAVSPFEALVQKAVAEGQRVDAREVQAAYATAKNFNPVDVLRQIEASGEVSRVISSAGGDPSRIVPYLTHDLLKFPKVKDALDVINQRRLAALRAAQIDETAAKEELKVAQDLSARLGEPRRPVQKAARPAAKGTPVTRAVLRLETLIFERGPEAFYQNKEDIRGALKNREKLTEKQIDQVFKRIDRLYLKKVKQKGTRDIEAERERIRKAAKQFGVQSGAAFGAR